LEMASLNAADGDLDSARKGTEKVLSTNAGNTTARFLLAKIEHKSGNLKRAMELYRTVLETQPNNAVALNNLAYLLADSSGRPDEALPLAQKAKELAPDDPLVEGTLGWVLYQKGLFDAALPHLKTSAANNRTALSEYHLAMAYFRNEKFGDGRQTLDAALRLDPKLPEAERAKQLLAASKGK
jgi:Tfp pilus assembly protein PilF